MRRPNKSGKEHKKHKPEHKRHKKNSITGLSCASCVPFVPLVFRSRFVRQATKHGSSNISNMWQFFLFAFCAVLLSPLEALAQTSDDLFNGNVLQEVRLYIHPHDWVNLRLHYLEDTYYAAEFHWIFNGRDIFTPQVAMRSRGLGSRSPIKPSLKIEFSRYESQYNFLGLQNLVRQIREVVLVAVRRFLPKAFAESIVECPPFRTSHQPPLRHLELFLV